MKKLYSALGFFFALSIMALPQSADAVFVQIDSQFFDTNTECGGDCFGATYSLVVLQDNAATNNYKATLTISMGTYTGGAGYPTIGAVDFKPEGTITSQTLTSAPTALANWSSLIANNGQAAGNCQNGNGKFICAYDPGNNSLSIANNTTYVWSWDFSMTGDYGFGHLGVNYAPLDDSCKRGQTTVLDCSDGKNLSIEQGAPPDRKVPEPAAMLLLGVGLFSLGFWGRKRVLKQKLV